MDVMLEENPWYNPRRRRARRSRSRSRNPLAGILPTGRLMQGVGGEEVLGAVAGFGMTSLVPPMIVREGETMGGKIMRLVAGLATTVIAGMALKSLSPRAGRAAVVGGLAGVSIQAIQGFTPLKISRQLTGRIGTTQVVTFPEERSEETVSIIQP